MQIECTTKCNLKCEHCERQYWDEDEIDLSFEDFKEVIDHFPVGKLDLSGMGENAMNPDFAKILEYACVKMASNPIEYTTNLQILQDDVKEVLKRRKPTIRVSINGSTKEIYEAIQIGASWEKLWENIRWLLQEGIPFSVNYVVRDDNQHDVKPFIDLMNSYGIMNIQFIGIVCFEQTAHLLVRKSDRAKVRKIIQDANTPTITYGENASTIYVDGDSVFMLADGELIPSSCLTNAVRRDRVIDMYNKFNLIYRCKTIPEIAEYTGETQNEVHQKMLVSTKRGEDEWLELNPQTQEERDAYYKNTEWYVYDLASWGRPRWENRVLKFLKPNSKVLDFGSGVGDFTIAMANAGHNIDYYDVPDSKTNNYMKWRLEKRGIKNAQFNLEDNYDAIVCFDVVEHMPDPSKFIEELIGRLKQDGTLLLTLGFHDFRPIHISNDEVPFKKKLNELCELVSEGRIEVWRKK